MPRRIAIIAALPREIAALVRGSSPDARLLPRGIHLFRLENAIVVAAGMGSARASLAVEAVLAEPALERLISTGLAGACTPNLRAGEVVEASVIIDAKTGERYETGSQAGQTVLITTDTIADVKEKARLASTYHASLVEMEAATVARLAQAHGLAFRAVKGISDAHDFELQSLAQFAGSNGQFRTAAFAAHTAMRPWTWGKAVQLGRGSSKALAGLERTLSSVLREQ